MKNFILILFLLFLSSCGGTEEELKELESIKNQDAIEKQNENIRSKSTLLQTEINQIRKFLDAVSGEYKGQFVTDKFVFGASIKLISSTPEKSSSRVKSLEELEYELQNLALNVVSKAWTEETPYTGGCFYPKILPDFENGVINISSSTCPVSLKIYISNDIKNINDKEEARKVAKEIKLGLTSKVDHLNVKRSSIYLTEDLSYFLKRNN
jgi:hypothetical protein